MRGKVVVLNFWASWCGPCLMEMPAMKQFAGSYNGEVDFIYVSVDKDETAWKKAISKYKLTGNHFLLADGFHTPLAQYLKMKSVPRDILVKKNKLLVFKSYPPSNTAAFQKMLDESLTK